jgi:RNA polymerase sigma factor (TIGR02999 family)
MRGFNPLVSSCRRINRSLSDFPNYHPSRGLTSPRAPSYVTGQQSIGNQGVSRSSDSATDLLAKWQQGDQEALKDLIPLVYNELRAIAHHYLRRERSGHTLQSTALVHEAYLRLVDQNPNPTQNRAHFIAVAAKLMRQILVDYARSRRALKRGPEHKVELDESLILPRERGIDVIALDDALNELARRDAQQERIVELRFFGGLTLDETAEILDISTSTVKRDWNMAKAWLTREVRRGSGGADQAVGEN